MLGFSCQEVLQLQYCAFNGDSGHPSRNMLSRTDSVGTGRPFRHLAYTLLERTTDSPEWRGAKKAEVLDDGSNSDGLRLRRAHLGCLWRRSDSTGSTVDSVKGSLSAGAANPDAGRGKPSPHAHGAGASCKPPDGGPSPCARGDGGEDDEMNDNEMDHSDGGDAGRGDDQGEHRKDGRKMD
jgi:hypothetical protein